MIGLQECEQTTEATSPRHNHSPASSTQSPGARLLAQSPDHCNGYVRKARLVAGLFSNARSSFNDRHHNSARSRSTVQRSPLPLSDTLHRSNSSLELPENRGSSRGYGIGDSLLQHLRQREYGSHSSIDLLETSVKSGNLQQHRHHQVSTSTTGDAFFAMLQDYRPAALDNDQRSPGPSEFLRSRSGENHDGNLESCDSTDTGACGSSHQSSGVPQSPKLRTKLRFWNSAGAAENNNMLSSPVGAGGAGAVTSEAEEIARRRAFAHYDCQSLSTTLYFTRRLRCMFLNRRRNTTTGASAASMTTRSSTPDGENEDDDYDDGQSNELVKCCPVFRNEIGGEEERVVSLTRLHAFQQNSNAAGRKVIHRPPLAYGVSVLEFPPGETHWRQSTCPYQRLSRPIEWIDQGALYYRKYFLGQEHQNWFGMDEQLGPVAISIKREKVVHPEGQKLSSSVIMQYQYRLIIRTSELNTLRGAILEDAIPNIRSSNNSKSINTKEVLEYVAPEVQLSSLRLGTTDAQTEEQLLKVDEQGLMRCYKVGVMYCKADQAGEEEMYNNETGGPAFAEFLETIGEKVRLKGFGKYKAGLDNKNDSTGLYSVYTQYQDCEVMFHVSTMLPFTPNNRQQLLRKRHIGNDIVTIVFQEPGAKPFTPKGIRSQFQHVFILVRVINPNTENTLYKVAVSRSRDVPVFGPPIRPGGVYPKGKAFAEFLLGKIVNAENAAHRSEKFLTMATRTRQEYLKDLVHNQSTNVLVESGQKFSIFSSKKKDKIRPRFIPDACQRGAILWQVSLDDSSLSRSLDCFLGISSDSLVLIEELSEQIVFVTPCRSILGWSPQTTSLKIYHHQGECVTIHMRDSHVDRDELVEIMDRLKATTQGAQAQEISLTRNIMGQLGFHVQPDGIVTLVESAGQAWAAGLRQNSRLVEICKVAVATLKHDQMVDLLKTSLPVTLTVIPPLQDTSPRKGCTLQNCKYNEGNYEGDYENLGTGEGGKTKLAPQRQQAVPGNHKRIYERSFSPPRSSNSSGYGTGTSCKSSYHGPDSSSKFTVNADEPAVAVASQSGGHVIDSSTDKWYDFLADDSSNAHPTNVNTFPSTPRRNNNSATTNAAAASINNSYQINQLQLSHTHFPSVLNHGKVQSSHSLPLQHAGSSSLLFKHDIANETIDLAYKLEKNNVVKQQNERLRQENDLLYYRQRSPKSVTHITNDLGRSGGAGNDSHSTDSSVMAGSEDELSNGSGNASPGLRKACRGAGGGGSRNQSPRSLNGEAKLKSARSSSNRNSANLSGSNFQEELLRLINPDTMESAMDPVKLAKEPLSHRSQENVNSVGQLSMHKSAPEVILTTARPATVISSSSAASSPLSGDFKSSKEEVNSGGSSRKLPHRLEHSSSLSAMVPEEFPLPEDVDWPSLVDTATKHLRVTGVKGDCATAGRSRAWDEGPAADSSITSSLSSTTSVPELRGHISELETRVLKETRKRMSLENEVQLLKEENRKLHEQAHAAVQQLRKFTEWFFRNVEKR